LQDLRIAGLQKGKVTRSFVLFLPAILQSYNPAIRESLRGAHNMGTASLVDPWGVSIELAEGLNKVS